MIPLILAVAAVALYFLPLIIPKTPEPDDIAMPPLVRGGWYPPSDRPPPPPPPPPPPAAGASFPSAVSSLDAVVRYLVAGDRYGAVQADAARVLRAALVDAATPPALVQEEVLR
jgi:hypothetical protein